MEPKKTTANKVWGSSIFPLGNRDKKDLKRGRGFIVAVSDDGGRGIGAKYDDSKKAWGSSKYSLYDFGKIQRVYGQD